MDPTQSVTEYHIVRHDDRYIVCDRASLTVNDEKTGIRIERCGPWIRVEFESQNPDTGLSLARLIANAMNETHEKG